MPDNQATTLDARIREAVNLLRSGKENEGIAACETTVADLHHMLGDDHDTIFEACYGVVDRLLEAGRSDDAIAANEALAIGLQRVLGNEHKTTLYVRFYLADLFRENERFDDAIAAYQELIPDLQRVFGNDHEDTVMATYHLAESRFPDDKIAASEAIIADLQQSLGDDHYDTLEERVHFAYLLRKAGCTVEAIEALGAIVPAELRYMESNSTANSPGAISELIDLLESHYENDLLNSKYVAGIIAASQELVVGLQRELGGDHKTIFALRRRVAGLLNRAGRVDDAVAAYKALIPDIERSLGKGSPEKHEVLVALQDLGQLSDEPDDDELDDDELDDDELDDIDEIEDSEPRGELEDIDDGPVDEIEDIEPDEDWRGLGWQ